MGWCMTTSKEGERIFPGRATKLHLFVFHPVPSAWPLIANHGGRFGSARAHPRAWVMGETQDRRAAHTRYRSTAPRKLVS